MGAVNESAIGTLVERKMRFVMLLQLPHGRAVERVWVALAERIQVLPGALGRTLTWDRGKEMGERARFTVHGGVRGFFCDPRSPWQGGRNENTNGLLRQCFPKGTDLSIHDEAKLEDVPDSLNTRPRQTLGWKTPAEAYAKTVAMTD